MTFSLRHATAAWWAIFLPAMVSLFRSLHFYWVPVFFKRFLLRHVTAAQLDTFLQSAANFLPDPQYPQVS
jgi:hypothetical protein